MVAMFSAAFTYCFAGQYLQLKVTLYTSVRRNLSCKLKLHQFLQGELIIDAVYDCCWYNIDYREAKILNLILKKTQDSLILSGGRLFILSNPSFLKVKLFICM